MENPGYNENERAAGNRVRDPARSECTSRGDTTRRDDRELRVIAEPLTCTPTHLNITPDDTRLVLREGADRLWLYDIATSELDSLSLEP